MKIQVTSGKRTYEVRLPDYPPDPKEERMIQSILRKFGLADNQDYDKYLDRVVIELYTRRIGPGKYTKRDVPAGFYGHKRNSSKGGKAP
jgi:hypothetical protein